MKEHFWESLERFLAEDTQQRKQVRVRLANPIEEARKAFVLRAKEELLKYEQSYTDLKSEAQEKLIGVIVPWWEKDIIESGLLARLLHSRVSKRINDLVLNNPIIYTSPDKFIGALKSKKPFHYVAEFMLREVEQSTRLVTIEQLMDERLRQYLAETWKAKFHFSTQKGFGLNIVEEPTQQPTGCGSRALYLYSGIDFDGAKTKLPKTHPQVIVNFADQISREEVWARLEKSIKGRR